MNLSRAPKSVALLSARHSSATLVGCLSCITLLASKACRHGESPDNITLFEVSKNSFLQHFLVYILVVLHVGSSIRNFISRCKYKSSLGIVTIYAALTCLVYLSFVYHLFGDVSLLPRYAIPVFLYVFDWKRASKVVDEVFGSCDSDEVSLNGISKAILLSFSCIIPKYIIELLILAFGVTSGIVQLELLSSVIGLALATELVACCTVLPALLASFCEVSSHGNLVESSEELNPAAAREDHVNILKDYINSVLLFGLLFIHGINWLLRVFLKESLMGEVLVEIGYIKQQNSYSVDEVYFYGFIVVLALKYVACELSGCLDGLTNDEKEGDAVHGVQDLLPVTPGPTSPAPFVKPLSVDKTILPTLSNNELVSMLERKEIPLHGLESLLKDLNRAVNVRRLFIAKRLRDHGCCFDNIPWTEMDYEKVHGVCCENVVGYATVPIGVFGPLHLDSKQYYVPLATTEGCLVASTNRGCAALRGGGVSSHVVADGMTRGPIVRFPSAKEASIVKHWIEVEENYERIEEVFNATSRFLQLKSIKCTIAGRLLFIRFRGITGDAMGMNMLSKGTEAAMRLLRSKFADMEIVSISGNFCTDKKPSAINWIDGRGKYVVCEAIVTEDVVKKVLKTSVDALIDVNTNKNFIGSAMAGSIGGQNAHASNIVTGIFIATGQDPAQNVESSSCITILEAVGPEKKDLYISCTMPSLEVGTVGGGTNLPSQAACLEMLGVHGSGGVVGENANRLARVVCGSVLAGELSLLSALASGHLVKSHLKHNRSSVVPAPFNKCPVL